MLPGVTSPPDPSTIHGSQGDTVQSSVCVVLPGPVVAVELPRQAVRRWSRVVAWGPPPGLTFLILSGTLVFFSSLDAFGALPWPLRHSVVCWDSATISSRRPTSRRNGCLSGLGSLSVTRKGECRQESSRKPKISRGLSTANPPSHPGWIVSRQIHAFIGLECVGPNQMRRSAVS